MLILNLKTYPESTGTNIYSIFDSLNTAITQDPSLKDLVFVAPANIYLSELKSKYPNINILAQTVSSKNAGSTTGWIPADNLVSLGINMAIYNHSEYRQNIETIVEDIKSIQAKGIKLIVCCENVDEAAMILEAEPFAIAYEPKDLIGSGISVTTRPEAVIEFISFVNGKTIAIIGAGVTTKEDVENSIKLGGQGVLLASAYVKAEDKGAKLKELIDPFLS